MAFVPIATGVGSALGGLFSGKGASDAANITAQAAERVAQTQAGTAAQALEFQKEAAAQDLANANVTALGNYNQYKARETALNTLRSHVGAQPLAIPAYTPYVPIASAAAPNTSASVSTPDVQTTNIADAIRTQSPVAPQQQAALVTMRAPNGQTSQVTPDQVAHYQSLGAQVVG